MSKQKYRLTKTNIEQKNNINGNIIISIKSPGSFNKTI